MADMTPEEIVNSSKLVDENGDVLVEIPIVDHRPPAVEEADRKMVEACDTTGSVVADLLRAATRSSYTIPRESDVPGAVELKKAAEVLRTAMQDLYSARECAKKALADVMTYPEGRKMLARKIRDGAVEAAEDSAEDARILLDLAERALTARAFPEPTGDAALVAREDFKTFVRSANDLISMVDQHGGIAGLCFGGSGWAKLYLTKTLGMRPADAERTLNAAKKKAVAAAAERGNAFAKGLQKIDELRTWRGWLASRTRQFKNVRYE